jgi:hypothetical protein
MNKNEGTKMFAVGTRIRIVSNDTWNGETGIVTKVNGPKTREVEMDKGLMIWSQKISKMENESLYDAHGNDVGNSNAQGWD